MITPQDRDILQVTKRMVDFVYEIESSCCSLEYLKTKALALCDQHATAVSAIQKTDKRIKEALVRNGIEPESVQLPDPDSSEPPHS